ncbi:hypothetical protein Tco_1112153 [Tanacetum coccineum]|uniref:Uncharacterized protein n=1 Tax=Tanacetum coccineum TaxID=301880 RepID=A0ABQ5INP0_9ASTR
METTVGKPLRLGYGALRCRELATEEDQRYSTFEVGQGSGSAPEPERSERCQHLDRPHSPLGQTRRTTPGSLPISPLHSDVPSPVSSPLILLIFSSPVATPTASIPVDEDQFIKVGAQLELYRSILQDHTQCLDAMPPTLSLEQEKERAVMTFRALWRPVLALETWTGHVDTRMENMSRAGYDDHRLVHDLLVQQNSLQHELQEMRGRVTVLERERDREEQ